MDEERYIKLSVSGKDVNIEGNLDDAELRRAMRALKTFIDDGNDLFMSIIFSDNGEVNFEGNIDEPHYFEMAYNVLTSLLIRQLSKPEDIVKIANFYANNALKGYTKPDMAN